MRRLKIAVRPESSFISKLQSDTLFGQFCWTFRDLHGDNALRGLLSGYKDNPFLVFSDGFPEGSLPVPFLPPATDYNAGDTNEIKSLKRKTFMGRDILLYILPNLSWQGLIDFFSGKEELFHLLSDEKYEPDIEPYEESTDVHKNSINRLSSTVQDGNLYHTKETFYKRNIDIYAVYDEALIGIPEIKEVMNLIGKTGFGKDKSAGKGRFSVISITEEPRELVPTCAEPNIFISLSCGVPAGDAALKYGKVFTKFGKHGGSLASQGKHIKNPVIMLKSGSIFSFSQKKDFYGMGLELDPAAPGHFHSAYMIPLFGRLSEEAEND